MPEELPATLLSSAAVARQLGVSERTVRAWALRGDLPATRIGKLWRFDPEALQQRLRGSPDPGAAAVSRDPSLWDGEIPPARSRAERVVRILLALGYLQKQIAHQSGVSAAVVSRILSDENWPVSPQLAERLERTLRNASRERLGLILHPTVLDTCNDSGLRVDDDMRSQIARTVLDSLVDPSVPFPEGIQGALLALGDGNFLVRANDPRSLIHELQHVIARLREKQHEEPPPLPRRAF